MRKTASHVSWHKGSCREGSAKRDHQEALTSGHVQPGLLYEEIEDDELWPPLAQRCRTTGRTPKEGMEFEEVCVGGVGGKAGEEKRSSGYIGLVCRLGC